MGLRARTSLVTNNTRTRNVQLPDYEKNGRTRAQSVTLEKECTVHLKCTKGVWWARLALPTRLSIASRRLALGSGERARRCASALAMVDASRAPHGRRGRTHGSSRECRSHASMRDGAPARRADARSRSRALCVSNSRVGAHDERSVAASIRAIASAIGCNENAIRDSCRSRRNSRARVSGSRTSRRIAAGLNDRVRERAESGGWSPPGACARGHEGCFR